MNLRQDFNPVPEFKTLINIGALFDIPTGFPVKGKYGEAIWLGGLGMITAIAGRGNMFKSTLMHYMMLSALYRLLVSVETSASTYDTEINIHIERLKKFCSTFRGIKDIDVIQEGLWSITDNTRYHGEEYFSRLKEFLKEKLKHVDKMMAEAPFMDSQSKLMMDIIPSFNEYDSFSEFVDSSVNDMMDKNDIGASGGNTVYMRQGLGKSRLLMELPTVTGKVNHFTLLSAHVGAEMNIQQGPFSVPPPKKLQHMKQGEKIKGVTDRFFYLLHNCWMVLNSTLLVADDKSALYPLGETFPGDLDLNLITVKNLRCKSGTSGFTLEIVVSQSEGVLPSLTEFNHIKNYDRFGLEGNTRNYSLSLYPEVKLMRTTLREKLTSDPKLVRAMNITSEYAQLVRFHRSMSSMYFDPLTLREKLTKAGYDVDWLLENTRGWWTYNNDKVGQYFLSTVDIIKMANEEYKPYWLEDDRRTVKKTFLRDTGA